MEAQVEENVFMARISEQAERFVDMVDFLKIVVEQKGAEMSSDERTLISVAFKNLITSKRTAWRTVRAIQVNTKYKKYEQSLEEYRERLENNLFNDCSMIIDMI